MSNVMVSPAETRPKAPARRPWWPWVGLLLLAAAAAGGAWYYFRDRPRAGAGGSHGALASAHADDPDDAPAGDSEEPVPVETVRLTKGGIARTSTQVGSVHPYDYADLYAKVSGFLKEQSVDYGSKVKKGDVLAVIDDPEVVEEANRAKAALSQAHAAVKQSEARLATAKADKKAADASVTKAEADVERYTSERSFREKVLDRHKRLVARQAIPQEVADEDEEHLHAAMSAETASRAAVTTARAQATAAQARVDQAEADIEEARATVKVDEAELAKARVFVEYTKIRSPYDGVVTLRNFFPGAFIRSATEGGNLPVLSVARTDRVRVATVIPDRDVPYADVGDPAEIRLDALGSQVLKGKISRFSEREDPNSRTMYTEIDLPNPDGKIRPGMYGIATIALDKDTKNSTLPASCLVGEAKEGKADVYVVKKGRARKTSITVGADDGLRVEVLSGISPDDEVIVSTGSVTDGTPVRTTQEVASTGTTRTD